MKKKLKKAQQHLSRKKKGSNGFEKQKLKVARIHEKIASCRLDTLHKISYQVHIKNQYYYFVLSIHARIRILLFLLITRHRLYLLMV